MVSFPDQKTFLENVSFGDLTIDFSKNDWNGFERAHWKISIVFIASF